MPASESVAEGLSFDKAALDIVEGAMALGLSIIVALLLVAATVILHYELLQFAGTLPERLPSPTRHP